MRFPWRIVMALSLGAAVAGGLAGWRVATLTETDVIEAAAAAYVAETPGALPTHCVAEPGPDTVWIAVICGPPGEGAAAVYHADRLGRVTEVAPPLSDDAAREI